MFNYVYSKYFAKSSIQLNEYHFTYSPAWMSKSIILQCKLVGTLVTYRMTIIRHNLVCNQTSHFATISANNFHWIQTDEIYKHTYSQEISTCKYSKLLWKQIDLHFVMFFFRYIFTRKIEHEPNLDRHKVQMQADTNQKKNVSSWRIRN